MAVKQAVLLLAHGSPDSPADVPEFMRNVTGGREIPAAAMREIAHRYAQIGGSPLRRWTERQAQLVSERLGTPVGTGMRNWKPTIAEAVERMAAEGILQVTAICMAPQNSRTSVGLYRKALFANVRGGMAVEFVESWHDHPLLIRGFADALRKSWNEISEREDPPPAIIFTAHSVPESTIRAGDPYAEQACATAQRVAEQLPQIGTWRFAFQSQGLAEGAWIGPTVEETMLQLKREGHNSVLLQPVGFLCDHIEVLYDIDVVFKNFASENGMRLERTKSLNDSPLLADALADLARSAMRGVGTGAEARAGR